MRGITHAGVGATAYIAVSSLMQRNFSIFELAFVVGASLLPDIDHPKSKASKYVLPVKSKEGKRALFVCLGIAVLWFDYLYLGEHALKALGVLFIMIGFTSHRNGITHSLVGMMLFMFVVHYTGTQYGYKYITQLFAIGYGSHLFTDSFTKAGLPLFYPITKKKFKGIITYRVGSKVGDFIEMVILILCVVYIIYTLPSI